MIKLKKVDDASYKGSATYEWEGHIIERDQCGLSGDNLYWYCKTLFKNRSFRTLIGLKKAIQMKIDGTLTDLELSWCEEE